MSIKRIILCLYILLSILPCVSGKETEQNPGLNDCTFTPSLNGSATVCESSSGNIYTTDLGGTGYAWTISPGGIITAGSTTNTVTVTWTVAGNQWISVDFTSAAGCTAAAPAILNVTVNPNLQASVSVAAAANPVCQGITAAFTATPTNGGTSPSYQWKVNNVNQGTNSPDFSYLPANNDQVKCVMGSNYSCPTGNPATSNTVVMAVSPNLPVSVSVTATPSGPVCAGEQVTFTATPANGGTSPTYQWKVNGLNVGTNYYRYTYIPLNGDVVTCLLNSNTPCSSGNPATSVPILMTVTSDIPVGVSITASGNPVCEGTLVDFTATPVNGGSSPTYQWVVNGIGAGTNNPLLTFIPLNGDQISCYLLSSLSGCATNNPAASNVIPMTVYPIVPVSVSIGVSANPVCAGTQVTYTAYPVNGGSGPSYQWKVNNVNTGTNSQTFNHTPLNGDVVTCVLTSSEPCPTGNPASSNAIGMTVYQVLPVSVSITASANPVCTGSAVTITATPVNGGSLPIYEWYVNGIVVGGLGSSYTYIPAAGDQVNCRLTSFLNCTTGNPAYSNMITMNLDPELPVSVSITSSQNPFCQGQPVDFTAVAVNGGTTPFYHWQVNGINMGSNNPLFSYAPSNGDGVTCILSSNANCAAGSPATSNTLVMIMNPDPPLPVSVSIAASSNPVCTGAPVTITAIPVNGGGTPSFQWQVNGINVGTNNPGFTYTPGNNDIVSCILTSSAGCTSGNPAMSNTVTMTVSLFLPVSVTISASANPSCLGTTVTFTANPVNGGPSPGYQWKVNGVNAGTNTSTYAYTPANGDIVSCILSSSSSCSTGNPATSNPITMTVNSNPVSVSITASANPVCPGTAVTMHATPVNGGAGPTYQWQVNGIASGTNSPDFTYIPGNGDAVSCILISNLSCPAGNPATSNTLFITVDPILPVSVTISALVNPVCQGSTVLFTATPTHGGTSPAYQWQVNGANAGTNSPTFSYIPVNNDLVSCILTSNYTCPSGNPATSNIITMLVTTALPVSVSITASSNPVCLGSPVTFTALPVNGGASPAYQWKVNGGNAGTNSPSYTYLPSSGDLVSCVLTSNHSCATGSPATSNSILMNVLPYLPVSVTISAAANPVCQGTAVTFTAAPLNGGTTPSYQWQVNGINAGTNSSTFTYTPINADQVICILTSNYPCASWNPATSNMIAMTVNPSEPVSLTIVTSSNPSCVGAIVTFTATPHNGGTNPVYQWQVNGVNSGTNSPLFSYVPSNGDLVSCIVTSNAQCPTGNPATSNIINQSVNPDLPVSVTITPLSNPVCEGFPVTFTATPVNGGSTPAFQWQVNGVNAGTNSPGFTYIPANNDQVRCILTSAEGCTTGNPATSNSIAVTVSPSQPVSVTILPSSNPICTGTMVIFTALPVNGGLTPSYQWKVNGLNAGTNSSVFFYTPVNGDLISCILTSNTTCPTGNPATSNTITMNVSPSLIVSCWIMVDYNPSCQGGQVIYHAFPTNGGSSPAYQWQVNGVNAGTNSSIFTYVPVNGDQVHCILTSSYSCPATNPVTSNNIIQSVVPSLGGVSVTVTASANPCCAGDSVTFIASGTNEGTFPAYQWQVNGINRGSNNPLFKYPPANGDVIVCLLTSSLNCTLGNPASSYPLTMTVNPVNTVSIAISTPSTSVCAGTPVTFTASPVNPGSAPLYQWQVNGVNAGTNSPTFTYTPLNGDQVNCSLTSNALCPLPGTAMSNTITLSVAGSLPVSVTITANPSTPVCAGTPVSFTANAVNGGISPTYQWQVNGATQGTNIPTFSFTPGNNDQVICILTSDLACAGGNPAISNTITLTVNPYLTVSLSISTPSTTVCEGSLVTLHAVPVNEGANPVYQWQVNGINAGTNSPDYSYIPVNGDMVNCQLTSGLSCITGSPATSNTVTLTVNPALPVSVIISAPSTTACQGSGLSFTASPVNGGTSPSYQWQVNGINAGTNSPSFTCLPADGDLVKCILTSNALCATGNPATSNIIQVSMVPSLLVSCSITTPLTTVCQATSITFTALPVNGGTSPSYQWQVNGVNAGTDSPGFTYIPADNDLVTCILTSNYGCPAGNPATSNIIAMTVIPALPVSVSISTPTNPVCSGSPVPFTAIPVNGGTAPIYQWQVNGTNAGTNIAAFTYIPSNGDLVSCILTSNQTCAVGSPATSNIITMTVNPLLPVSVSINPSANPACQGVSVTFTATPVNGGTSPSFQWQINGINAGANTPVFICTPTNNDAITCILTSGADCPSGNPVLSNTIIMNITPNLPVSISIGASANPSCPGSLVTFTATPVNGGASPSYQWQVNGSNTGSNSSTFASVPTVGDLVSCILTSSESCISGNPATSNTIVVTNGPPLPVSVSITAAANPVCQGAAATFTAAPLNGGTTPSYQWQVNSINSGPNASLFTYYPSNNDQVKCVLTSSYGCPTGNPATSNTLYMAVSPNLPVSVTITPSSNPVCAGSPVIVHATALNGGSGPVYQWKVNGINGGTNSPDFTCTPQDNDVITCVVMSNIPCSSGNPATSPPLTMTVSPTIPVSVTIAASTNPVCAGNPIIFTATPVNGGNTPFYQWVVNGTGVGTNDPVFTYTPSNGDLVSCYLLSSLANCAVNNPAASNVITMTVNYIAPVSVTIGASANPVCAGTLVTYTAYPVYGGLSPSYQWYVNGLFAGSNSNTLSYIPTDADVVSCILTSSEPCPINNPFTSNAISMTVYQVMPVSVTISASSNPVCTGNPVTFTATPVNGGSLPIYEWNVNGTPVGGMGSTYSFIPADGDLVSCRLTSYLFCTSGNPAYSNTIQMILLPELPVNLSITASQNPFCLGAAVIFTAIPVNGGSSPSYQWQVNGINTGTNNTIFSNVPANGDVVTCVLNSNATCATGSPATSNTLVMILNPDPPAPVSVSITASSNPVCTVNPVSFTAAPVNGGASPGYQWKVNGSNAGTNNSVFMYIPANGDLVSCVLNSSSGCASGNPATSNVIPIVKNALVVTFDLCNPVTTHDAAPFTLGLGLPLNGIWSGAGVAGNIFTPSSLPGNRDTVTVTYTCTNSTGCIAAASQVILLYPSSGGFVCGQPLTDVRDSKVYSTVQIGTRCWMAQNLDFGTFTSGFEYQTDNCLAEKYCYNDLPAGCVLNGGGLYQWDELMQYQSAPGTQGLCPPAWHIPREAEWFSMESTLNGQGNAGDFLKAGGFSGFNALLPGLLYLNNTWSFPGFATFFWTSTPTSASRSMSHALNQKDRSVSDYPALRSNAFPVRCIKD